MAGAPFTGSSDARGLLASEALLMSRSRLIAVALGLLAAVTVVTAHAQDQKSTLPAAVAAAFKKAYPNATIKNSSSEKEDGTLQYEIESIDGATHRDLVYLADGTLVAAEEAIDATAVPAPVLAALKARYPKATVTKYERLTKGATVSYEMTLKGAAVKEAEIAPDGTFINPKPVKK
jgi:hypothetical protein